MFNLLVGVDFEKVGLDYCNEHGVGTVRAMACLYLVALKELFAFYSHGNRTSLETCLLGLERFCRPIDASKIRKCSAATPTALKFLHGLSNFLPGELQDLQFEYIKLSKTCSLLLNSIRKEWSQEFKGTKLVVGTPIEMSQTDQHREILWTIVGRDIPKDSKDIKEVGNGKTKGLKGLVGQAT